MATAFTTDTDDDCFTAPFHLSIAGTLVEGETTFDVINPATGKVFAQAPAATAAQMDSAVAGKDGLQGLGGTGLRRASAIPQRLCRCAGGSP